MSNQDAGLAGLGVLAGLSAAHRDLVIRSAALVRLAPGERLFREETAAEGCWLIHDGCVALDLTVPGRGQVVIQTLGGGDVVGWSWLIPPYQWHFGAVATRATTATKLDTGQLLRLADEDPRFGYALALTLFQACAQRLQATRARLLDLYRSPS
jgi:CRP/FNR family transcriptional regulator, cyclic AMP receptor protein